MITEIAEEAGFEFALAVGAGRAVPERGLGNHSISSQLETR